MGEETLRVDPNEDLDALIARLKGSRSKDVVLVLPKKTRALQTLDNFYALRKSARDEGMNLTFSGGDKTMRGLAKLLGFRTEGGEESAADGSDAASFGMPGDQITMPPPQQQAAFEPAAGPYVQRTQTGMGASPLNGGGRPGTSPRPAVPTPDEFFNNIPDMPVPSVPQTSTRENGLNGNQGLDRNSGSQIPLNSQGPDRTPSGMPSSNNLGNPAKPNASFDFGGSAGGSKNPLNYEDAINNGFFGSSGNLSQDFKFEAPSSSSVPDIGRIEEDDFPAVPPLEGDTAASRFRRPGVRRDEEDAPPPPAKGRRNRRTASGRPRILVPAALVGMGTRVRKIINPVTRTNNVGMMRPELSNTARERRRQQGKRTTMLVVLLLAVLGVGLIALLLLSLGSNKGNFIGEIAGINPTKFNLIYKTVPVSSTVSLLLDTNSASALNGTQSVKTGQSGAVSGSNGGRLPATQVSPGTITAKGDYPSFGSKMVAAPNPAQGTVTFYNGSSRGVTYTPQTILFTNKAKDPVQGGKEIVVSYHLQTPVTVPPGNPLSNFVNSSAKGVIVADTNGSVGNLPNGFSYYIENAIGVRSGPIGGGSEQTVKVVSPQDQDALKKQLEEKARTDAQAALKDKYNPATQDIQIISSGDPSCTFSKKPGEIADTFSGTCSVNSTAYVYNKSDLQKVVQDNLVTDPRQKLDPSAFNITGPAQLKNENNRLFLAVPAVGKVYTPVDLNALKEAVAGKPVLDVPQIIATGFPQIEQFDTSTLKGDKMPEAKKIEFVTTPFDPSAVQVTTPGSGTNLPGGNPTAGSSSAPPPSASTKP